MDMDMDCREMNTFATAAWFQYKIKNLFDELKRLSNGFNNLILK